MKDNFLIVHHPNDLTRRQAWLLARQKWPGLDSLDWRKTQIVEHQVQGIGWASNGKLVKLEWREMPPPVRIEDGQITKSTADAH